jgi:hypothetical protein
MVCAAPSLGIEKRMPVGEIVEAAFWDYLENGQSLVTEDTYRKFPAGYKLFYWQRAIKFRGTDNGRLNFLRVFHNVNVDSQTFSA